jgi:hypothetical protein
MKMKRFFLIACGLAVSLSASAALHVTRPAKVGPAATSRAAKPANLSAAQIVERNVAARGGLDAWRAVNTLTLSGQLEAGGKKNPLLPFVMQMKRPRKSRLEISFQDQTAVQVYDGEHGWKVRPFLGRDEVESFTPAEAREAANWAELDGPLVDYAAKGTQVALDGTESVEGHPCYRLKLTLKGGAVRHVWIDAATFLERKIDGDPHRLDGRMRDVAIFYRDFKSENGLKMPRVLETVIEGGRQPHKMTIERVAVNQPLADSQFAKPGLAMAAAAAH